MPNRRVQGVVDVVIKEVWFETETEANEFATSGVEVKAIRRCPETDNYCVVVVVPDVR